MLQQPKLEEHIGKIARTALDYEAEMKLATQLAQAIKSLSAMVAAGAECMDVVAAAAQCAIAVLPGTRAIVVEVHPEKQLAIAKATANATFINTGQEFSVRSDSAVNLALTKPNRVHTEKCSDSHVLCPGSAGFPSEPGDILSAKAILRPDTPAVVITMVSDPEMAAAVDGVLMVFSELLAVLGAGRKVAKKHTESIVAIACAKQEWERTVDALPELVFLIDQNGRVVRANRTIERWGLGDVKKVAGLELHALLHPDCKAEGCVLRAAVSLSALSQSNTGVMELTVTDSDLERDLSIHIRLLYNLPEKSSDSQPCAVIVISDLTDLRKSKADLAALNVELEERVRNRTVQIEAANRELQNEVARRRVSEDRLSASREELAGLSNQLMNVLEEERKRLSRELHDSLGQSLGAIKYSIEDAVARIDSESPDDIRDRLSVIIERISAVTREARATAVSLRPPVLDELGPVSAVSALCRQFTDTFTTITFDIQLMANDHEIPAVLSTSVYRVVQEGLNNVVKHAMAKRARLALWLDGDDLWLEIQDDGVGFDSEPGDTGSFHSLAKMGHLGMRERVTGAGGQLDLESSPGAGVKLTAVWPLSDLRDASE